MKSFLKTFFFLILQFNAIAQLPDPTARLDQLKIDFINEKETVKASYILDTLFFHYITTEHRSPDASLLEVKSLIQEKGDEGLRHHLLLYRVMFMHTPDSINQSRKFIKKYLPECRRQNDKMHYFMAIGGLSQKESAAGNYEEALALLLQSLDYARDTLKDVESIGAVHCSLGVFYFEQRDTLRSID